MLNEMVVGKKLGGHHLRGVVSVALCWLFPPRLPGGGVVHHVATSVLTSRIRCRPGRSVPWGEKNVSTRNMHEAQTQ